MLQEVIGNSIDVLLICETKLDNKIENLLVEINLHSKTWLISGSYNPYLNSIENHLVQFSKKSLFLQT